MAAKEASVYDPSKMEHLSGLELMAGDVKAHYAHMTKDKFAVIVQRMARMHQAGVNDDGSQALGAFISGYLQYVKQSEADPDGIRTPETLTAGQLAQFKCQVIAFRALTQNRPLPQGLLIALGSVEGCIKYVREQEARQEAVRQPKTPSTSEAVAYEEGPLDTSSAVYPFNAFVAPTVARLEYLAVNRAIVVPNLLPNGLDPLTLRDERNRFIEARRYNRMAELESLPSTLADGTLKLKALIELKSLNLLEKQRRLREDVLNGIGHATDLSLVANRTAFKRDRKVNMRETRVIEQYERKQKLEREQKAKQKHLAKLLALQGHATALREAQSQHQQASIRMGRQVARFHQEAERAEKARLERLSKDRLRALKADDEEAYLKLIDTAKDTRITHLLKQTDSFLSQLSQSVVSQQKSAPRVTAIAPPSQEGTEAVDETTFGASAVYEEEPEGTGPKVDYYNVAHRIKEPVTKQPDMLTGGTLKSYQLKGLQWMISLFNNRLNGILADEMGLGKTIQTISLITYLIEVKKLPGPFLIIVPLSTMPNWVSEFAKWAPDVKVLTYKGTPNVRKQLGEELRRGTVNGYSNKTFQVCVTTYEFIIRDRPSLARPHWAHMIIDEGHRLKNTQSKLSVTLNQYYRTQYRLILTGTPLQNNLPELWALLNFVLPKVFNSVQSFDEWFNTPFANTGGQDKIDLNEEESLLVIRRLHKVLRPFLLRRLKKDVEADLPDKVERIIRCKMSSLQLKLYKVMKDHGVLIVEDPTAGKKQTGLKGLQNTVMQLRKICNHPFVYQAVESSIKRPHQNEELLYRVAGKFELLDRILPKLFRTGHRVLMFFQMTQIMDIMQDYLAYRQTPNLRLDGNTNQELRGEIMRQFNAPDCPIHIFLLSTRAGGLGLNLQTADTVILFDSDWNPHQDLQAQDRAHRIGQKKEVRIFRLVTSSSVEEHIVATANMKKDMDSKVIQAGKFDNASTAVEREEHLRAVLEAQIEEEEMEGDYTDAELNEILARGDEEFEIFQQMDSDRRRNDEAHWRAHHPQGEALPERLIQEWELPPIYRTEYKHSKKTAQEEESELFDDSGARRKRAAAGGANVHYDDGLTEDQFLAAVEGEDGQTLRAAVTAAQARRRSKHGMEDPSPAPSGSERGRGRPRKKAPVIVSDDDDDDDDDFSDASSAPNVQSRKRTRVNTASVEPSVDGDDSDNPRKRQKTAGKNTVKSAASEMKAAMKSIIAAVREVVAPEGYLSCSLFVELPDKRDYADYYLVIPKPLSLKQISQKINKGAYDSPNALKRDFELMIANAHTYNDPESAVARDANDLKAEFDVRFAEAFGSVNRKRVIEDDDEDEDEVMPVPKIKLNLGARA